MMSFFSQDSTDLVDKAYLFFVQQSMYSLNILLKLLKKSGRVCLQILRNSNFQPKALIGRYLKQ